MRLLIPGGGGGGGVDTEVPSIFSGVVTCDTWRFNVARSQRVVYVTVLSKCKASVKQALIEQLHEFFRVCMTD
jgi:hypothetical protein